MSGSDRAIETERIARLAREGGWIAAGQIAAVLGALLLVRILTSWLDPEEYGQLSLGLTVAGLVNQVVMGGVGNGIGRYYSIAREKQDLPGYLGDSSRIMKYATGVVAAIGLVLMAGLITFGHFQWLGLAAAALMLSLFGAYSSTLSSIQNAARQRAIVAMHRGLDAWLRILLAVGVMFWLGSTSTAVVIGYVLSSLLITVSQFVFLLRLIPAKRDEASRGDDGGRWLKQIWTYSWPFSVWGLFTWAQQSSDRWALALFESTHEVGFYAVLFQLGYVPILMVSGMATSFLGPILFQRAGDASDYSRIANTHRLAWQIVLLGVLVTMTCFLLTLGLHAWVFRILVAPEYRVASYLLPWVVLAGGLFAAGQMLALKLMSELRSVAMISAKIATAVLGVLLNLIGAYVAGIEGITGALVAFSAIYFAWMAWLAFRLPGGHSTPAAIAGSRRSQ